jgi:glutathionylspermidine synthase
MALERGRSAPYRSIQLDRVQAAAQWKECLSCLVGPIYLSSLDNAEDRGTVDYLASLAESVGFRSSHVTLERIGCVVKEGAAAYPVAGFPRSSQPARKLSRQSAQYESYVRKPIYSREGAKITVVDSIPVTNTPGLYGSEGFVYRKLAAFLIRTVNAQSSGVGTSRTKDQPVRRRESDGLITDNHARFVPHLWNNEE